MQVHAAMLGCVEDSLRENAAVSDHESNVSVDGGDELRELGCLHFRRLLDTQTESERFLFHRRRTHLETATRWTIRLANDESYVGDQRESFERWNSDGWSAEKYCAHSPRCSRSADGDEPLAASGFFLDT
jgi:hypothetical protein